MKNGITKFSFLFLFLFSSINLFAQSSSGGDSNLLIYTLIAIAAIILLYVISQVADNLIKIEAREMGVDSADSNYSIMPSSKDLFSAKKPGYLNGDQVKVLKKGHDILLEGVAAATLEEASSVTRYAVQPKNFIGMSPIPKVVVEIGDEVKAGDVLFFDKKRPEVKYVAPVSGEVVEVNRAEKRSIAEVVVLADKEQKYKSFEAFDLENGSREDLVKYFLESGLWSLLRQRPFDTVPNPTETPRDIFITTFDTAPLAPDSNFVIQGNEAAFQKGLDVLGKLTSGQIYLGLNANGKESPSAAFANAQGVNKQWFKGKHPAGNVGVQIHHTAPIGAKDKVWVVNVQEVVTIGKMFIEQKYDASKIVAITGHCLSNPRYLKTYQGANLGELLKDEVSNDHARIISGDVLSGQQKSAKNYLNMLDDQVTTKARLSPCVLVFASNL